MLRRNLTVSLALVMLLACLYDRGGLMLLPTVLLPILAHELSHVLALWLLGQKITGLTLDASGLCIRYKSSCTARGHILAALSGPLGGLLYALLASRAANCRGYGWMEQSAGVSLLLTAFNLMPLLPLDGGRVFSQLCLLGLGEKRGTALFRSVSAVLLSLLLTGGALFAVWKKSTAPLAAAIWLMLLQGDEEALVKRGEII